jgi:hypothetical protein
VSSLFLSRLNKTITVTGRTLAGEDGYGQPMYTEAVRGTVRGRIDPRGGGGRDNAEVVNGPDLNPVISDFLAITELPSGFEIEELDTLTDDTGAYEALGVATLDGRSVSHHLEISLRRIA